MLCSMTFHEYKNGCLFRIWVVLGDVTREGIPRRIGRNGAEAQRGMRGNRGGRGEHRGNSEQRGVFTKLLQSL